MRFCACLFVLIAGLDQSVNASDDVTLRISSGTITIASDELKAQQFRDDGTRGAGMLVVCRRLHITGDAKTYMVVCDDITFVTAAGVEGTAKQAKFDSKSKRVILTGDKDSPVHLTMDADSDQDATHLFTGRIEVNLTILGELPRDRLRPTNKYDARAN